MTNVLSRPNLQERCCSECPSVTAGCPDFKRVEVFLDMPELTAKYIREECMTPLEYSDDIKTQDRYCCLANYVTCSEIRKRRLNSPGAAMYGQPRWPLLKKIGPCWDLISSGEHIKVLEYIKAHLKTGHPRLLALHAFPKAAKHGQRYLRLQESYVAEHIDCAMPLIDAFENQQMNDFDTVGVEDLRDAFDYSQRYIETSGREIWRGLDGFYFHDKDDPEWLAAVANPDSPSSKELIERINKNLDRSVDRIDHLSSEDRVNFAKTFTAWTRHFASHYDYENGLNNEHYKLLLKYEIDGQPIPLWLLKRQEASLAPWKGNGWMNLPDNEDKPASIKAHNDTICSKQTSKKTNQRKCESESTEVLSQGAQTEIINTDDLLKTDDGTGMLVRFQGRLTSQERNICWDSKKNIFRVQINIDRSIWSYFPGELFADKSSYKKLQRYIPCGVGASDKQILKVFEEAQGKLSKKYCMIS